MPTHQHNSTTVNHSRPLFFYRRMQFLSASKSGACGSTYLRYVNTCALYMKQRKHLEVMCKEDKNSALPNSEAYVLRW